MALAAAIVEPIQVRAMSLAAIRHLVALEDPDGALVVALLGLRPSQYARVT